MQFSACQTISECWRWVGVCDAQFSVEAVVREYHKCKDIWVAVVDEELSCRREPTNQEDRFAVVVDVRIVSISNSFSWRIEVHWDLVLNCLSCRFKTPAPGLK